MADRHTQPETQRALAPEAGRHNGHVLVAITEYLPGKEPTDYGIELTAGPPYSYRTRFWRCRICGQERTRPTGFLTACEGERRPHPLTSGGYSIDDPRTRRALSEDMTVHFGGRGPGYRVESESGSDYEVDIEAWSCSCPDFQKRGDELPGGCKHLRRVDLEIRTGVTPQADGTFFR